MNPNAITRPERPSDAAAIESLQHDAFGPGAYTRAAFRVREQAPHDPDLSFLIELDGGLIGSVRLTPVRIGEDRGGIVRRQEQSPEPRGAPLRDGQAYETTQGGQHERFEEQLTQEPRATHP